MPELTPLRFVVLAQARSGSNLLCGLLNSHPQILCHHGLFNSAGIHYATDRRDGSLDFGTVDERDGDPRGFLDKVWATNAGCDAVGFKINRAEHDGASDIVLPDPAVRKILLRRRNRVKAYVSSLIAQSTGEWESYGRTGRELPARRVHVDPAALFAHVDMVARYYAETERLLTAAGQMFFRIDYESLTRGPALERLLQFLGVPDTGVALQAPALVAPSYKRNPFELRQLVVNFEDLSNTLRGTELEDDLGAHDLPEISKIQIPQVRTPGVIRADEVVQGNSL